MKFGCWDSTRRRHRTLYEHVRWLLTWVSTPRCLGLGTGLAGVRSVPYPERSVDRPRTGRTQWTHWGASSLVPREGCNLPSHWTLSWWGTEPTVGASGVWQLQVQAVVNGAPDALRSASGASVFWGIRVADPWIWWGVFILLHLIHGRSLAHLISWETPCGAREKEEPKKDWGLRDFLSESFSSEFQKFKCASTTL